MKWLLPLLLVSFAGCIDADPAPTDPPTDTEPEAPPEPFESLGPYEVREASVPGPSVGGLDSINRTWRMFLGTGNCCENYLMTSPSGGIYDFGGTFIQYTLDEGRTWDTVGTTIPYQNGEGAIANAPGGDIVAVGWDPYTGDQAWAHHYENSTDTWSYQPMPLHVPFWDREWVVAIPGPFTVLGAEVPYISIARGGWPYKETLLVSGDGVTYATMSVPDATSNVQSVTLAAIDAEPNPERDWLQPATETTIIDIGGARALKQGLSCPMILDDQLTWKCLVLSEATLAPGRLLMDGKGSLHAIQVGTSVDYAISHDGGRSWQSQSVALPEGMRSLSWDYKAHAALDQTIVAIHADDGGSAVEILYRFTGLNATPTLVELVQASTGGGTVESGVAASGGRYDFMTTALLPDGRAILSVSGGDLPAPTLAVELA